MKDSKLVGDQQRNLGFFLQLEEVVISTPSNSQDTNGPLDELTFLWHLQACKHNIADTIDKRIVSFGICHLGNLPGCKVTLELRLLWKVQVAAGYARVCLFPEILFLNSD